METDSGEPQTSKYGERHQHIRPGVPGIGAQQLATQLTTPPTLVAGNQYVDDHSSYQNQYRCLARPRELRLGEYPVDAGPHQLEAKYRE